MGVATRPDPLPWVHGQNRKKSEVSGSTGFGDRAAGATVQPVPNAVREPHASRPDAWDAMTFGQAMFAARYSRAGAYLSGRAASMALTNERRTAE
jgi:hypothetical protein